MTEITKKCKATVRGVGMYGSFNRARCSRDAKPESDYCGIHNPDRVATKRAEREQKWKAESSAKQDEEKLRTEALKTIISAASSIHTENCETDLGTVDCQCELAQAIRVCERVGLKSAYESF